MINKYTILFCSIVVNQLIIMPASAVSIDSCMQQKMINASDNTTIGELRSSCMHEQDKHKNEEYSQLDSPDVEVQESAIARRLRIERAGEGQLFSLQPHKPNYIMISHNMGTLNEKPFVEAFPNHDTELQSWETTFQISLKVPVARDLFDGNGDLFVAYTNRSFWQQFNKDISSPFRDSNHEPEVWLSFNNDSEVWGFKNSVIRTGFAHQSNGQAGSLSRSWNRVYADFIVEKGNFYFSFKPWLRISEDFDDDDNPDINDYMGNFEFSGLYKKNEYTFDFMLRNNLDFGDNNGAIKLGWSFPLSSNVKGYVQWFNGYGESLINYDAHSNTIGLGIKLSDWL